MQQIKSIDYSINQASPNNQKFLVFPKEFIYQTLKIRAAGILLAVTSESIPAILSANLHFSWLLTTAYLVLWQFFMIIGRTKQFTQSNLSILLNTDHLIGGLTAIACGFNIFGILVTLCMMLLTTAILGGWILAAKALCAHILGIWIGFGFLTPIGYSQINFPYLFYCLCLIGFFIPMGALIHTTVRRLNIQKIELSELSFRDELTGLHNRRYWNNRVTEEHARFLRGGHTASLVLIDLDHFKRINDSQGHSVGDDVIRRFGEFLKRDLRSIDVACRYGGEEFALLLPNTSPKAASEAMHRLKKNLQDTPLMDQLFVTASFGIAGLTSQLATPKEWINLADRMLYQAKNQGRNQICIQDAF
ncbi:MAG: GGDEF domain-containing protein [Burkholderiaceae bacterium]|jgi:diguanylate cyclase|nr:GGDEF domain-containing protein [Burkholderiaceae bacterium]